jgi:hypothetical protein
MGQKKQESRIIPVSLYLIKGVAICSIKEALRRVGCLFTFALEPFFLVVPGLLPL